MIKKILSAAVQNVKTNLAQIKKNNSIGLNPVYVKYLKIAKSDKITAYKLFNHRILYINKADLLHSLKEIFIEEVYKIDLRPDATIIDCGANIGLSAIYFKRKFPNAKIIAFEPDNTNYDLITANIKAFKFGNVEIRKEAVWDKEEILHFKSINSLGSMITTNSSPGTYSVNAVSIKKMLDQKIDLLKMDIEGAEYNVLNDVKNNLSNVDNIFIEYHGMFDEQHKLQNILKIIDEAGFNYYIKEAWNIFKTPFFRPQNIHTYDVQLNLFCFKKGLNHK